MLTILQSYDSYSYESSSSASAAGAAFGFGMLIFYLAIYLFLGFCRYKVFQKAGRQDAWAGFIPVYNAIVLGQILKKPGWFFILFYIPIVYLYAFFVAGDKLARGFGKGDNGTIWGVIGLFTGLFVNFIAHGFGSDKWDSSAIVDETQG